MSPEFAMMDATLSQAISAAREVATLTGKSVPIFELFEARSMATRFGTPQQVTAAQKSAGALDGTIWIMSLACVVLPRISQEEKRTASEIQRKVDHVDPDGEWPQ